MARITDSLVIQRVADNLVFVDGYTGAETVVPVENAARIIAMVSYLANPAQPTRVTSDALVQLIEAGAI